MRKEEMEIEIRDTRERFDNMMLRKKQEARGIWRYEWPIQNKEKWTV
jgi:hypothetical protein